jgi:hypothetical protein
MEIASSCRRNSNSQTQTGLGLTDDIPQKIKKIRQEADDKLIIKGLNRVITVAGNIVRDRRVQAQKDEKASSKQLRSQDPTVTKKLFTLINQSIAVRCYSKVDNKNGTLQI